MITRLIYRLILIYFGLNVFPCYDLMSQSNNFLVKHKEVAFRMIGHELLKLSGDTTSRVLPIMNIKDQYSIQFEKPVFLDPGTLTKNIDSMVEALELADHYIVEVRNQPADQVVYSYERNVLENSEIIPCQTRKLPEDQYRIVFNILRDHPQNKASYPTSHHAGAALLERQNNLWYLSFLCVPIIIGLIWIKRKDRLVLKQNEVPVDASVMRLDLNLSLLFIDEQRIELTGKEALLLRLLMDRANETVEKHILLNEVWGDNGEYIGRTLDVFISKLRKKLEPTTRLKIVNMRGVGYRLVVGS